MATGLFLAGALEASCGANGCPLDVQSARPAGQGDVRLDYTFEYVDQSRPRIGTDAAGVGEQRGHHDEVYTVSQVQRLGLEVGITDRFSLQTNLPFIHREHQHIHHHMGADIVDAWNFSGLGDLEVLGRYAVIKGGEDAARVTAIAGGVLPTGRDRALNAGGDEAETGILPGKSAYALILGGAVACASTVRTANGLEARMPMFLSSTYQWNNDGDQNYRIGNFWLVNAGVTYPLFRRLGLMAQLNARVSRKDDRGNTREEVEKTGGTYVYASPGIELGLSENLTTFVSVQLPVYQRVNAIQLTSDYNFVSGLTYKFSAL